MNINKVSLWKWQNCVYDVCDCVNSSHMRHHVSQLCRFSWRQYRWVLLLISAISLLLTISTNDVGDCVNFSHMRHHVSQLFDWIVYGEENQWQSSRLVLLILKPRRDLVDSTQFNSTQLTQIQFNSILISKSNPTSTSNSRSQLRNETHTHLQIFHSIQISSVQLNSVHFISFDLILYYYFFQYRMLVHIE